MEVTLSWLLGGHPPRPCVSYFLLSVTKIPDKSNTRQEEFILVHGFRGTVWSEEHRTKFLHIVGNQEEESALHSMLSNKLQRHVKNLIPPAENKGKNSGDCVRHFRFKQPAPLYLFHNAIPSRFRLVVQPLFVLTPVPDGHETRLKLFLHN